jgi:quinol monooxygenase YgiN
MMLWARIETQLPRRRELVLALLDWAAAVRREPGVIAAHLSEDLEEAGVYCLVSSWRSSDALETHLASPDFGVLAGALQVLGHRSQIAVMEAVGAEDAAARVLSARARMGS